MIEKPTIAELEKILDEANGRRVVIAPDGRVSVEGYTEKDRRIYYQDIVYGICNLLDTPRHKILCGTCEHPSGEVSIAVKRLIAAVGKLTKPVDLEGGSLKKARYKLSPELSDGHSSQIVNTKESVIDAVKAWCDDFGGDAGDCCDAGESLTVEVVHMTDAEVEALPDL